jgi:hypothetical protein
MKTPAYMRGVAVDAECTAPCVVAAEAVIGDRDGSDWNAGLLTVATDR